MCAAAVLYDVWQQKKNARSADTIYKDAESVATLPSIHISTPESESVATSPLIIEGSLHQDWFINGPVELRLVDNYGKVISNLVKIEEGSPDIYSMISFKATLLFTNPKGSHGFIEVHRPKGINEALPYEYRLHILFQ